MPRGNELDARQTIRYVNNSPDTLRFIWMHLWPNAYKNDKTALCDQLLKNGNTSLYFSNEEKRGYINRIDFSVEDIRAETEDHPIHQDIIKLILPSPLPPGRAISIKNSFHVRLPENISRSGYINGVYAITQWYPKPAVYDNEGWHEMPYLDMGEFYNEFGRYDVRIKAPANYVIGASGEMINKTAEDSFFTWHFVQDNIHDFAFFAGRNMQHIKDTLQIGSRTITVNAYHRNKDEIWKDCISFVKNAVRYKSKWIGEYPYNTVSVFQKPEAGSDGMEYPTITFISSPSSARMLEYLIHHEVGHNWFQGILASNERRYPWMDEGMNSYYDRRYFREESKGLTAPDFSDLENIPFLLKRLPEDPDDLLLRSVYKTRKDQPINTPAEQFSAFNYDMIAYRKAAAWMALLEKKTGRDSFDNLMQEYYREWKFKHPAPDDFRKIAAKKTEAETDSLFSLLDRKGPLEKTSGKKKLKTSAFFNLRSTEHYNYMNFMPALGYNYYDKLMAGALIHNYSLPLPNFRFFAAPLYAFGSKQLRGTAAAHFRTYTGDAGAHLEFFISGATFSNDVFRDSTSKKNFLSFRKLTPGARYTFATSGSIRQFIQWKTYLISETSISFRRDTVQQVNVITYPRNSRYVNQLLFRREYTGELYPWRIDVLAEQSDLFARLNLTGTAFLNYPKGGGLNVRFFAGKFIYLKEKTASRIFEGDRYRLNLTGANGYEDYTYSNYFIGRNEFEGMLSRQIMMRDGAFKVRSDLLSNKIGKTDDWLTAINLSTTIPPGINPLEMLPFKIPIRIFADIGTYSGAWKKDANTGKFLYDLGLQLSLFNNTVNIYAPLFYSKPFRDYIQSTITEKKFWRTLSFSIDIQKLSLHKTIPPEIF